MRRPFIAGNWKMHHLRRDALAFAPVVRAAAEAHPGADVAIFPPATLFECLRGALQGSRVQLGGQDCHFEASGAFTGALSAAMLGDAGCTLALVGHGERRALFGDDDAIVRRKLDAVLAAGLTPVACVGESEAEREAGRTEAVLERQLAALAGGLQAAAPQRRVLAYEPLWAIGTGRRATPEVAQAAHAFLRRALAGVLGPAADQARILYGGSVRPESTSELLAQPDIDGLLVGGASLEADSFAAIIAAA